MFFVLKMSPNKSNLSYLLDEQINSLLNEASSPYFSLKGRASITFNEFLSDRMLLISVIKAGIPYKLFELIQNITPFSEFDWAKYLNISAKSLQRYKAANNFHFKSIHSEKILEMAEVTQYGLEVFGQLEKFNLWLNTPNFALANYKPIELLSDSYGKELVITELSHINQGIFS